MYYPPGLNCLVLLRQCLVAKCVLDMLTIRIYGHCEGILEIQ